MEARQARATALLAGHGYGIVTIIENLEKYRLLPWHAVGMVLCSLLGLAFAYSMLGLATGARARVAEAASIFILVCQLVGLTTGRLHLFI